MTDDPPNPSHRDAAAAYRSAGKLRQPSPAPQIVRLIEQPAQQIIQHIPAPEQPASPQTGAAPSGLPPATHPSAGVSLMITNAQKDGLRRLGISEEEIRGMSPAEAHRRLGLTGR